MKNGIKTKRELSKASRVLVGYADDASKETYAAFGGAVTKDYENGKIFAVTIANTGASAVDRLIAIFPGYFPTAAEIKDPNGVAVAGILTEGNVVTAADANLVANGDSAPADEFLYFVKNVPTAFSKLRVEVDDKSQLNEPLLIKKLSPFDGGKWEPKIKPSLHRDLTQLDDLNAEVPLHKYDFQLDNQTLVLYKIKANRTVTLSFFCSEFMNTAAMLDYKRKSK